MSFRSLTQRFIHSLSNAGARADANSVSIASNITSSGGIVIINGVVVSGGSSGPVVHASGPMESRDVPATDFCELSSGGVFNVTWRAGAPSIVITAQQSLHKHIQASIDAGGRLTLSTDATLSSLAPIEVLCSSSFLSGIDLAGAGVSEFHGLSNALVKAKISGAATASLEGSCGKASLACSGAAKLDASNFRAVNATLKASGSSDLHASFEAGADIEASGSSRVDFNGAGAVSIAASGSAHVKQTSGACSATVQSSGAAEVAIVVQGAGNFSASGASSIKYRGDPQPLASRTSGAGSVSAKPAHGVKFS